MWNKVVFDIESDGLLDSITTIHCIGILDIDTQVYQSFYQDSLSAGLNILRDAEYVAGHNIIDFDIPAITKLYPEWEPSGLIVDTCILSRLFDPDITGGHSLNAWGRRLNFPKMDFRTASIEAGIIQPTDPKGAEFVQFSDVMLKYVEQDVRVTRKLLGCMSAKARTLGVEGNFMENFDVRLEHTAQRCMSKQAAGGWTFDVDKAKHILHRMKQAKQAINNTVHLPPFILDKGLVAKPFTKAGKPTALAKRRLGEDANIVGPFTAIEVQPVSKESPNQLKTALLGEGWKPDDWTEKGSPRLTESSLLKWGGKRGTRLAKYLMYSHRIGLVQGLLEAVREDGRVPAGGIAQGAVTGRVTHRVVANIPRPSSPMGKEIRSLFVADPGQVLVSADASGLELRCLAHYLNDPEITKEILEGDIHQKNADAVGVDRNTVKATVYAWLYGSGDENLGKVLASSKKGDWLGTKEEGKLARLRLESSMNAAKLIDAVKAEAASGYIRAIDGRKIPVRSEHAALNMKLQSCGAIVMKLAWVKLMSVFDRHPEWGRVVCFYHDEYTATVDAQYADQVRECMVQCIRWAGKKLKMRVPLNSEGQIGKTWRDVH